MRLIQGILGALISYPVAEKFFGTLLLANFWLRLLVGVVAGLTMISIAALIFLDRSEALISWQGAAGLAAIDGTEIGRRVGKTEFL